MTREFAIHLRRGYGGQVADFRSTSAEATADRLLIADWGVSAFDLPVHGGQKLRRGGRPAEGPLTPHLPGRAVHLPHAGSDGQHVRRGLRKQSGAQAILSPRRSEANLTTEAQRHGEEIYLIRPVVGLKQRGVVPGAHILLDARRANNVGPSFAPHDIFMTAGGTRVARMGRKGAV